MVFDQVVDLIRTAFDEVVDRLLEILRIICFRFKHADFILKLKTVFFIYR
jgi:hypothetical protein